MAALWCHPHSLYGVKWVSSRTLEMGIKRKCAGRRQTEFPEDLFKDSVQPMPFGLWHKALGNTQGMLLGEQEDRRDMKFKAFVFQMWQLWKWGGQGFLSPPCWACLKGCACPQVGILDVDLCGPSIPRMLRVQDSAVHQCDSGWVPVFVGQDKAIALMSIGFLLERPDDAVVWRGPKKNALIKQFVSDVAWGELDFLIVDTPPGTSDEHISTVEALRPHQLLGAVLVTTPQAVSVGDVRRELTFCRKAGLHILGIVENMSGFVCPHCSECTNIFSKGGGEELAKHAGVPFLGCVPLDPQLSQSLEEGRDFIQEFPKSSAFPALTHIAQQILDTSQRSS
uniref:NUBP iron-sulfur cluster assembly factor 2, cytosolic n=1 Tax=Serinus canaria TaxID=9135 RepID=A0A8C9UFV3_SERCA